jgi:hypothetical protein
VEEELWKQAYRAEFGSDPDDDMDEHGDDVEAWRASWQSGYDAREEWALALVGGEADDEDEEDEEDEEEADDE